MKKEVTNFIIIGAINTLFYYFLYTIFIYLGFDYKIATLFANIFGVLFNFKTFGKYVFKNADNRLIFKFILSYVFLYFTNILFIKLFNFVIDNLYITGFLALIPQAAVSFIVNKFFVFRK